MPDPSNYDNEESWMEACIPAVMDEGKDRDAAIGQCIGMWRDRDKSVPPSVDRAWSVLTVKSVDAEQRTIEGVASTPTVDRIGDIVEPLGAKFTLPMPLLHHHKHDQPVGQVIAAKPTKDGISIKARFAKVAEPGALKERIDTAWQEVKAGLVRGLSIGFKPIEYEFLDDKSGGLRFSAWNWYELSLVTIPANADAQISVIKSIDADLMAAPGREEKGVAGWPASAGKRPGVSGKSPVTLKMSEHTMSKTISEQVRDLENSRAAKAARMSEIMQKSMDEGRSTDEAEQEEFDTLEQELGQLDGDLKRLHVLEKVNQAKAKPVAEVKTSQDASDARGGGYIRVTGPKTEPGIRFARVAKSIAMARGNLGDAAHIGEQLYGDDQGVVNVLKAAVAAGTATDATWAGPLVTAVAGEAGVFGEFLEFLRPKTVIGRFGTNGIPALRTIPFRVGIIGQTTGGTAAWTGEGAAKPLTKVDFERRTLLPLKVAAISVITDELARDGSPNAERLVRDALVAALVERLDIDFLDPAVTAIPGVRPASISSTATPIVSSGVTEAAVRTDIQAVMSAFLAANNPPTTGVWVMSSQTALALNLFTNALGQHEFEGITLQGGSFFGMPVIVSDYVPTSGGSPNTKYVFLINASDVLVGDDGGISIDTSREASLEMADNPTHQSGGVGSPALNQGGVGLVSMWQTNSVALRVERSINYMLARTSGVQVLSGVVWNT